MENSPSELVAELLRECGYKAKVADGGYVATSATGVRVGVWTFPNNTIQLISSFSTDEGSRIDINKVNKFNSDYRYLKLYLDDDQDLTATWDFYFDISNPDAAQAFERIMLIFESALGLFKETFGSSSDEG